MGCRYELHGEMKLYNSPELQEQLDNLYELCEDMCWETEGDIVGVQIHIEGNMSFGRAGECETRVRALAEHAVEAARFDWDCDGESGFFYTAKTEEERIEAHSKYLLNELIMPELRDMTTETLTNLRDAISEVIESRCG